MAHLPHRTRNRTGGRRSARGPHCGIRSRFEAAIFPCCCAAILAHPRGFRQRVCCMAVKGVSSSRCDKTREGGKKWRNTMRSRARTTPSTSCRLDVTAGNFKLTDAQRGEPPHPFRYPRSTKSRQTTYRRHSMKIGQTVRHANYGATDTMAPRHAGAYLRGDHTLLIPKH